MLTPADAGLARRDPALAGLATVLDPDSFADLLRTSIPRLSPTSVIAVYVRYKPATRCLVSYEVTTPDGTVRVHANACTAHRAREKLLGGSSIAISVFPDDDALPSLARIWRPAERGGVLKKLLPAEPAFWEPGLSVLAYKPGRRCVAALRGGDGVAAVLKAYTASGFLLAATGARAFRSNGSLHVPRVVGRSRRHHLLAFEWLPGDSLQGLIESGRAGVDCLKRVGAALAAMHAQNRGHLEARAGGAALRDELTAIAAGVGWLCPELAQRAATLAVDLAAHLGDTTDNVPLHGDFYSGQVLVGSETIGIVDMDRASLGDPRMDVANFIAHLECDALEGRLDAAGARRLGDALIDGYEEVARRPVRRGLEMYIGAALLRLAPRPFRTRQVEWPALTAALISRAEPLMTAARRARSGRGAVAAVSDPFGVLADRALSLPPAALDPDAMALRLADLATAPPHSVAVHAVRVSRHKPGRRCLIEYDVSIDGPSRWEQVETVIAKVRAKGADTRTYRLTRALWRNGFRGDSADGVSVARPLGVLPDLKMWVQLKMPGMPVTMRLTEGGDVDVGERVADAIHKLHCHRGVGAPLHGIDDELRILGERLHAVAAGTPAFARRLDVISRCCTRIAPTLPRVEPRGIHRDFYADQLLEHGRRMYVLDLDLYAAGDPALDVGNFLGHISEYSLRTFGDATRLAPFEAAMTHRFLSLDPTASASAIEAYKTLTLARLIHVSTIVPERRPFTAQIVHLVESRLG